MSEKSAIKLASALKEQAKGLHGYRGGVQCMGPHGGQCWALNVGFQVCLHCNKPHYGTTNDYCCDLAIFNLDCKVEPVLALFCPGESHQPLG